MINTIGEFSLKAVRRNLGHVFRSSKRAWSKTARRLRGASDTWWDNQDRTYLENSFLRDAIDGIDHPSRVYLREWLKAHPNRVMLDIPCGPGVEYEGLLLDNIPVTYIGMDLTDTILGIVKEKWPATDFRKGNILDIPLPDDSVDIVLCRHILEHLHDWRPAVREAMRVATEDVFIILFRKPVRSERHYLGQNAWDNRIDWNELKAYIENVRPGAPIETVTLPYPVPVPDGIEENLVIRIAVGSVNNPSTGG